MKAWKAYDIYGDYSTIVFAPTAGKAKQAALFTDACEDSSFINIRVKRVIDFDKYYKGFTEVNWQDPEIRLILVRDYGWSCFDAESYDCTRCSAKDVCPDFQCLNDGEEAYKEHLNIYC